MESQKDSAGPDSFTVKDKRFWSEDLPHAEKAEAAEKAAAKGDSATVDKDEPQRLTFQAETRQLLDLMIYSLYSHKEIFLRELISNASDALDRRRFEGLTQPELLDEKPAQIRIETDAVTRTLTVHDNGIGMSRDEIVQNIGTIARSGTRELLSRVKTAANSADQMELIGQFGVGFYSSFMVANRISLVTRRAGEDSATSWESTGDGTFTVKRAERATPGTSVTLHLKPADEETGIADYLDQWTIQNLVKKYSDFVRYPIVMEWTRTEPETDDKGNPVPDGKQITTVEEKTLNSMKAIWKRRQQDVSEEEYEEFYHHISHHWDKPLRKMTLMAEGRVEYQAIMFIPEHAPYDLFHHGTKAGLQLYVRSVKIMDQCEQLLPHYLRFVRGVVEASDLPLNVSRELLQQNRQLLQIQKGLVKKVLDTLSEMQEKQGEDYLKFWNQFGRAVKEGVGSDIDNKDRLVPLLMFHSSADPEKLTTLKEYRERMKEDQSEIYYLTGDSRQQIEGSPHLEAFRERGYEVLFLVDPVDELLLDSLTEFDDKKLKSVGKGEAELGSEEEREKAKEELKDLKEASEDLLKRIETLLGDTVKEVRLSSRLTTSPVCLVTQDHDYSPHLRRLMQQGNVQAPKQRRILELNPKHPVFERMKERFALNKEDEIIGDYAKLLYGQALLSEGSELSDSTEFVQLVTKLMVG